MREQEADASEKLAGAKITHNHQHHYQNLGDLLDG